MEMATQKRAWQFIYISGLQNLGLNVFYCEMCDISGNFVNGSRIGAVHLDNIAINFCNLTDICVVSRKGVRVLSFRAKESELVSNYTKKSGIILHILVRGFIVLTNKRAD